MKNHPMRHPAAPKRATHNTREPDPLLAVTPDPGSDALEIQLAERLAAGDSQVIGDLEKRFGSRLLAYLRGHKGVGWAEAQDLLQEVWLGILSGKKRDARLPLWDYLVGVAKHKAVDHTRKQGKNPSRSLETLAGEEGDTYQPEDDRPRIEREWEDLPGSQADYLLIVSECHRERVHGLLSRGVESSGVIDLRTWGDLLGGEANLNDVLGFKAVILAPVWDSLHEFRTRSFQEAVLAPLQDLVAVGSRLVVLVPGRRFRVELLDPVSRAAALSRRDGRKVEALDYRVEEHQRTLRTWSTGKEWRQSAWKWTKALLAGLGLEIASSAKTAHEESSAVEPWLEDYGRRHRGWHLTLSGKIEPRALIRYEKSKKDLALALTLGSSPVTLVPFNQAEFEREDVTTLLALACGLADPIEVELLVRDKNYDKCSIRVKRGGQTSASFSLGRQPAAFLGSCMEIIQARTSGDAPNTDVEIVLQKLKIPKKPSKIRVSLNTRYGQVLESMGVPPTALVGFDKEHDVFALRSQELVQVIRIPEAAETAL